MNLSIILLGTVALFALIVLLHYIFPRNIDSMQNGASDTKIKFDIKDSNVEYHLPADTIASQYHIGTYVLKDGKIAALPWTNIDATTVTYDTSKNYYYVPTYEDSVYLGTNLLRAM